MSEDRARVDNTRLSGIEARLQRVERDLSELLDGMKRMVADLEAEAKGAPVTTTERLA